jgi:hypothetical protein
MAALERRLLRWMLAFWIATLGPLLLVKLI